MSYNSLKQKNYIKPKSLMLFKAKNLHFLISGHSFEHSRIVGQFEGAEPDGVDGNLIVKTLQRFP